MTTETTFTTPASLADPVRELLDEHAIFMAALEELAATMDGVPEDASSLPPHALGVAQRIWHDVDEHLNTHFVKEEEIFFPAIERLFSGARVKFQFLHVDHDKLRECFHEFTHTLQDCWASGSSTATVSTLKRLAKEMVRLFYYHIIAEDVFYFDVATSTMTAKESAEIMDAMRALEDRLRERVH